MHKILKYYDKEIADISLRVWLFYGVLLITALSALQLVDSVVYTLLETSGFLRWVFG